MHGDVYLLVVFLSSFGPFHREDTAHADRATSNLSLIHGGHFNHALVGPCTDKRQWIVTFRISCMKLMAGYGN